MFDTIVSWVLAEIRLSLQTHSDPDTPRQQRVRIAPEVRTMTNAIGREKR
ncbi:hypothetical protein HOV93_48860 [Planctomycetes bacterium FF15]|uniref:Uncharacterized protein n=1 Tax=Bremerella alba TaxID=980252 RepID=A0A7V8VA10_9BACT|nr:hypothetical protein [Bremerella alba]